MAAITHEAADRLGKLILMLGSDHDGEVLSAVHAIRRTLAGSGVDLHALASTVTGRAPRMAFAAAGETQPSDGAMWNFANHFRQGREIDAAARHPDALAVGFGLALYRPNVIESWREVGRHCLKLNREIPKKHDGKFLRPFEIDILTRMADGLWPRNGQVDWLKTVVARCHQARDRMWAAAS